MIENLKGDSRNLLRSKDALIKFKNILEPTIEQAKDAHERLYWHHIYEEEEHRLDRLKALLPKLQAQVQNKSSLYFALVGKGTGWLYFMQAVMLGIIWAAVFSTQGTLFSELFPTKVRYTGLSVGYQFAAAIVQRWRKTRQKYFLFYCFSYAIW